ncbi:hypothetical protein PINS_up011444 [Pythium insidiosum]|nr:hypothetical protein PINS_up011444 [Pythium insidiosum]
MYIISSGEVVERVNWSINRQNNSSGPVTTGIDASATVSTAAASSTTSSATGSAPEIKVNVDLMLIGSADVVGEWPFVKNKFAGTFDIRAVHDVHALALHRRVFEALIVHATPETNRAAMSTLQKLRRLCQERDDWRHQRLACGAAYPDAHIVMYALFVCLYSSTSSSSSLLSSVDVFMFCFACLVAARGSSCACRICRVLAVDSAGISRVKLDAVCTRRPGSKAR